MGLALKRTGFGGRLVGVSRPETLAQALELGVVDEGWDYGEIPRALAGADLVFICTPIQRILALLEEVAQSAEPGALITDVGSTKRHIAQRAAQVLRPDLCFVGGHPMAGSEKAGVLAADPFLFQNAIYILTGSNQVPAPLRTGFVELLKGVGARIVELSPEDHDQVVAAISHLPQMIATTLVEMVGKLDEDKGHFLALAAGGFRDLTRIASSPYAPVWQDISATNVDQIRQMIDRYIAALQSVGQQLGQPALSQRFAYANQVRDGIPKDAKGFIHRLFELIVVAEDKPGAIAEIASGLAEKDININDIEIMKVREGVGGTIRLGFDSEAAAQRALAVLTQMEYKARLP